MEESIGRVHRDIMERCYKQNSFLFRKFGEKGIKVCEEWHDRENFRKWAKENGYVKGMSLQRKDISGDYCPENCFFGILYKKKRDVLKRRTETKKRREFLKKYAGIDGKYTKHPLYRTYNAMKVRCYNKNDPHYKNYGARGIKVCKEWSGKEGFFEFFKWSMENGWEKGLSIDRINNDGDYEPSNCRWADAFVQASNKRGIVLYKHNGVMKCMAQIAREEGISKSIFYAKMKECNGEVENAIEQTKIKMQKKKSR